jgi:hypothetical protein
MSRKETTGFLEFSHRPIYSKSRKYKISENNIIAKVERDRGRGYEIIRAIGMILDIRSWFLCNFSPKDSFLLYWR